VATDRPARCRLMDRRERSPGAGVAAYALKRDCFSLNRNHALALCLSMILSENRYPLFGIML
jgi:hypothetical protein